MGCIMGMGVVGPLYGLFKGRSFAAVKKYAVKVNKTKIYQNKSLPLMCDK